MHFLRGCTNNPFLAACRRDLFLVWNARFSELSEGHWHRFRAVQGCQTLENEVDRFLSDRLLGYDTREAEGENEEDEEGATA